MLSSGENLVPAAALPASPTIKGCGQSSEYLVCPFSTKEGFWGASLLAFLCGNMGLVPNQVCTRKTLLAAPRVEAPAGEGSRGQAGRGPRAKEDFYCPPWISPAPPSGCAEPGEPVAEEGGAAAARGRAGMRGADACCSRCRSLRRRPGIGRAR